MSDAVLVLAHTHDAGAGAVARCLMELAGPEAVRVVRPEVLGLAAWSHTVAGDGRARTLARLPGGVALDSDHVSRVFNRLQYLPVPRFHGASPRDRDYAGAELQALVVSWLGSLGERVMNPMSGRGQACGPIGEIGWMALATSVGLPVPRSGRATAGRMLPTACDGEQVVGRDWPGGTRGPAPATLTRAPEPVGTAGAVLVAGEEVVGSLADPFGDRCLELARRARCSVLEVRFVPTSDGPMVGAIDPMPLLLDPDAVAAVARALLGAEVSVTR